MARTSFTLVMLAMAGAMALLLGVAGIYGVISYSVSQRTREIGIRMALGARQQDVLGMVVGNAFRMAILGIGIGIGLAIALSRLLRGVLFGVSNFDPVSYVGLTMLLLLVALIASWLPARRASKVDPAVALHEE